MPGADLTPEQRRVLEGLAPGNNHYVAASEMSVFSELAETGFFAAWMSSGGVPMWRITEAGRQALATAEQGS